MVRRIVWPAVASAAFMAAAVINAWVGDSTDFVLACGSASIATAILALREK